MQKKSKPMAGLTVGRIVHFVVPDGKTKNTHLAAIIVEVIDDETGLVDLQAFVNTDVHQVQQLTLVPYSKDNEYGTWHWIEKA